MASINVVSLEDQAMRAVPNDVMIKFMSDVWKSPLRQQYWDDFKSRLSLKEMSRLAKTLPWDDPAARDLDFTVHKRRMHGKLVFFCFQFPRVVPLFFFRPLFFQIYTDRTVVLPFCLPCYGIIRGLCEPS